MSFAEMTRKDAKEELTKLLYLNIKDYNKYNLIINKKYSGSQPAIFYTALSRGYNKVTFEDLSEDVIFQMEEVEHGN